GDGPIQHKALSRRDSRPSYADVAARMKRQRNPGSTPRLSTPLPDFKEPVIGPATSGRTRWLIRATKRKGGGTPADAYLQPPRPHLHPPRLRGGQRRGRGARPAGRARLSAFHRGSCLGDPTPPLSSGYALPGTRP